MTALQIICGNVVRTIEQICVITAGRYILQNSSGKMKDSKLDILFRDLEKTGGRVFSHAKFWLNIRRVINYIGLGEALF